MKVIFPSSVKTIDIADVDSIIFTFNKCSEIQIGNQTWMCKNLNVDHYRNGDSIPEVTDSTQWTNLITGAWCYYSNDPAIGKIYGKLYNWYAVNDPRGLAPAGWHVPSDSEWKELEMCLGMSQAEADKDGFRGKNEGGKLKSTGTIEAGDGLWYSSNTGATNEYGFSALPGGCRSDYGAYLYIGFNCDWWSSTESYETSAWYRDLDFDGANVYRSDYSKWNGFSVRCIKNK